MALGHQDQESKNIRSTRVITTPTTPPSTLNNLSPSHKDKTHRVYTMICDKHTVTKSYFDQTDQFTLPSSRGNKYVFILYHYDTNSIHATPLANRRMAKTRTAWQLLHNRLSTHSHDPTLHILYNEFSQELKDAFTKYNVDFQRVPPKVHHANSAEHAILL